MSRLLSICCTSGLSSNTEEEFQDVADVDLCTLVFRRLGLSVGLVAVMWL
jgi:hypothetical protein